MKLFCNSCQHIIAAEFNKEVAELFKKGYSHQTERAKIEKVQSETQYDLVNKVWLPEVFKRIETLLTPNK